MQGQIGRQLSFLDSGNGDRLARPRSSGRSLEVRGNSDPREMITTVWEHIPDGTESGLQVFSTARFFNHKRAVVAWQEHFSSALVRPLGRSEEHTSELQSQF